MDERDAFAEWLAAYREELGGLGCHFLSEAHLRAAWDASRAAARAEAGR